MYKLIYNIEDISLTLIELDKIIKIAKALSIWVFEVGTCRGHKPIIDQSCGAVFVCR